jgi:hypothetical protein
MSKVKITGHASGSGTLTLTGPNTNSDRTITLPDATGTLLNSDGDGSSLTGIALNSVTGDLTVSDDLILNSDSAAITFGAGGDQTLYHTNDTGLTIKSTGTGDDVFPILTLAVAQTDINDNDYIGMIQFQAPDEGTGTDAILPGARIYARAEAEFSSSVNKTKLVFATADSGALSDRLTITGDGRGNSNFTAKAWAQWDGTTVQDSHNVSSVSNPATGKYSVNWDVDMANNDYAVGTCGHADRTVAFEGGGGAPTTSACHLVSYSSNGSLESGNFQSVICFGD